jgi:hypothetical protein
MVKAMVTLDDRSNRVLNIIKAKLGLRNKSETIVWLLERYETELLEPELRPEFVKRMRARAEEPVVRVESIKDRYGLD